MTAHADRWLLIETFGGEGHDEPTIIGRGSTPAGFVPLGSLLNRGRHLDDFRALVARVAQTGQSVRTLTQDGARRLVGDPLVAYTGRVHGVYAWRGLPEQEPPPRDPAGAWQFNLTTGKICGSEDLLDLYGVPAGQRRSERVIAEAFTRLLTNADEASALAVIVNSPVGYQHQATWSVRRDDDALRAANFACRVVAQRTGERTERLLRGITHDIGPADTTPSAPSKLLLAQQVLAAARVPGTHRAIVNLRNLTLLRWYDDAMPGVAWEHDAANPPALHPDDVPKAKAMSAALATAERVSDVLRVRATSGNWMPVHVDAGLILLDQHTTAALVTVRQP